MSFLAGTRGSQGGGGIACRAVDHLNTPEADFESDDSQLEQERKPRLKLNKKEYTDLMGGGGTILGMRFGCINNGEKGVFSW